ncbi:hypothetical protein ACFL6P_04100 [Candidatus Latescibacterota bacterium]
MRILLFTLLLTVMNNFGIGIVHGQENNSTIDAQTYYPLKIGSKWTYEGIGTTPDIVNTVSGTEAKEDKTFTKIDAEIIENNNTYSDVVLARCEDNFIFQGKSSGEKKLLFDFNAELNKRWTKRYETEESKIDIRTGRIVDFNMTVNVPAGTFDNCIVYEISDTSSQANERRSLVIYTYWLAPDVGIVKMSINIISGNGPVDSWVSNLRSYSIPE